jgi:hypothetical protein
VPSHSLRSLGGATEVDAGDFRRERPQNGPAAAHQSAAARRLQRGIHGSMPFQRRGFDRPDNQPRPWCAAGHEKGRLGQAVAGIEGAVSDSIGIVLD